jgi:hypothetical protein
MKCDPKMKTFLVATASTLTMIAGPSSAFAEQYEGVLKFNFVANRAGVIEEAKKASHGTDPYDEGASSGVAIVMANPRPRGEVMAEAVDMAYSADQNTRPGSRSDARFFAGIAPSTVMGGKTMVIRPCTRPNEQPRSACFRR